MSEFTYTIFDGNPSESGDCAWPSHTGIEIEADNVEQAMESAKTVARQVAKECGQYAHGDRVWVMVYEDSGASHKGSVAI